MTNRILLVVILVVAAVLAAVWWHNAGVQQQTAQRLEQMQRRLESMNTATKPTEEMVPTVGGVATTQNLGTIDKIRQTRAVMEEGWKLLAPHDPQRAREAVAVFQEGLEKVDGRNPEFYNGLGRAWLIAGQPRDAITAWRQGLALAPRTPDMQSGIGWGYWHLNDYYRAKQAWEKTLALDSKSPDAWSALAWIYLELGDFEKAKEGFQLMFARDKNLDWNYGLTMARAGNKERDQIAKFFRLPPVEAFAGSAGADPAPPATAPGAAPEP